MWATLCKIRAAGGLDRTVWKLVVSKLGRLVVERVCKMPNPLVRALAALGVDEDAGAATAKAPAEALPPLSGAKPPVGLAMKMRVFWLLLLACVASVASTIASRV